MLQPTTIQFLQQLALNNSKEWFDANRKTYDAAKTDFLLLTQLVLKAMADIDPTIAHLQPKDCIFRINRDVRFSQNKAPYKTNMGMSIAQGGKKGIFAGYYVHVEPNGNSFVGGGLYMAMPEEVKKVRQEIDYNLEEWHQIVQAPAFVQTFGALENGKDVSLSRPPKGYDANHPAIEFIKLKSWIATHAITDAALTTQALQPTILRAFTALQPLIQFINRALVG